MTSFKKLTWLSEQLNSTIELSVLAGSLNEINLLDQNEQIKGIHIGHETCESKIPGLNDLAIMEEICREKNLQITWVIPPVREFFFQNMTDWIEEISRISVGNFEIVVNDLGMIQFIKEKYPKSRIVLGRLLYKQVIDLRHYRSLNAEINSQDQFLPVNSDYFQSFLRNNGIQRVSFNNIPFLKNYILPEFQEEFKGTMYFPHVMLSTGKRCLWKRILGENKSFCPEFCKDGIIKISRYPDMPLVLLDNALLYYNPEISPKLREKGIDCIVVPVWWLQNDY